MNLINISAGSFKGTPCTPFGHGTADVNKALDSLTRVRGFFIIYSRRFQISLLNHVCAFFMPSVGTGKELALKAFVAQPGARRTEQANFITRLCRAAK